MLELLSGVSLGNHEGLRAGLLVNLGPADVVVLGVFICLDVDEPRPIPEIPSKLILKSLSFVGRVRAQNHLGFRNFLLLIPAQLL